METKPNDICIDMDPESIHTTSKRNTRYAKNVGRNPKRGHPVWPLFGNQIHQLPNANIKLVTRHSGISGETL